MSTPLRVNGFTNESLKWSPWLKPVDLETATSDQLRVLDESGPKARLSPYYLTLAHQSAVLRERSTIFNAIMYAPGGLSRAERELASAVVSCVNRCTYCASVHAQRFEQLAKRNDVIAQVFANPVTAGTTDRERAIVQFSIELTLSPSAIDAAAVRTLENEGLTRIEILDLIHSIAIFAWANRLMLNLGEPEKPESEP